MTEWCGMQYVVVVSRLWSHSDDDDDVSHSDISRLIYSYTQTQAIKWISYNNRSQKTRNFISTSSKDFICELCLEDFNSFHVLNFTNLDKKSCFCLFNVCSGYQGQNSRDPPQGVQEWFDSR